MLCVFTSINHHFSITNHLIILIGSGFRIPDPAQLLIRIQGNDTEPEHCPPGWDSTGTGIQRWALDFFLSRYHAETSKQNGIHIAITLRKSKIANSAAENGANLRYPKLGWREISFFQLPPIPPPRQTSEIIQISDREKCTKVAKVKGSTTASTYNSAILYH